MNHYDFAALRTIIIERSQTGAESVESLGLGLIGYYKGRYYIITAAHLIKKGKRLSVRTGMTEIIDGNLVSLRYNFNPTFINRYKVRLLAKIKKFVFIKLLKRDYIESNVHKTFKKKEHLDVVFDIPKHSLTILQELPLIEEKESHKNATLIDEMHSKIVFHEPAFFYSIANIDFQNNRINGTPMLVNLKYICSFGYYQIFRICNGKHKENFHGSSGAPVFKMTGEFLGIIIKHSCLNKRLIIVFNINKIKSLLELEEG